MFSAPWLLFHKKPQTIHIFVSPDVEAQRGGIKATSAANNPNVLAGVHALSVKS